MAFRSFRLLSISLLLTGCAATGPAPSEPPRQAPLDCATPSGEARARSATEPHGFRPLDQDDVPQAIGKTVYAGRIVKTNTRVPITFVTGEALTLCRAEEHRDPPPRPLAPGEVVRTRDFGGPPPAPPLKYGFVTVKSADGQLAELQLGELSLQPLAYDLRHPGDAAALLEGAFEEAATLAPKIDALEEKYGFSLMGITASERDLGKRQDYELLRAMQASLDASRALIHALVHGASITKESLLREKMWAVRFGDPALLDRYSGGIADPATRKQKEKLQRCLEFVAGATTSAREIRIAEQKKTEKAWRKDISGVSEAQLAALDAEKLSKLDDEIAKLQQRRQSQLASAPCRER